MEKVLKPYTIIPQELYVHRDADRQVEVILKDMGRPGYVLVSRQMGKTNLLLNAIREYKTEDDVYVYIDLSNYYNDAKECFENIIDTAIETNNNLLNNAAIEIYKLRDNISNIPAHRQHSLELRTILKSIKGKLVVILDEIDALTKTAYSDQIFSQIRSIYFSRINFPDFNRLTYLLSGVMEPKEIIKDPKISPFNIGQKIFLNDFSYYEFESFLKKSNLNLNKELKARIFYWTSGNPRMTWDICAEIESCSLEDIKISDVDGIVKDMYLTRFDKPPIDHIRELVKADSELRSSIIDLEYFKGSNISDSIKSKLYLAGIINYDDVNIKIKNNIIKDALSYEYIRSLEEEQKGVFKYAIEQYDKSNYTDAVALFEKYINIDSLKENERALGCYYAGLASNSIKDFSKATVYFENALKYFEKVKNNSSYRNHYYSSLLALGTIYFTTERVEESLNALKKIINDNRKDEVYFQAATNSAIYSTNANIQSEASRTMLLSIVNDDQLNTDRFDIEFVRYAKSVCYYNLYQDFNKGGDIGQAKKYLTLSIENSVSYTKPIKYLTLFDITTAQSEKKDILLSIIEIINSEGLEPEILNKDNPFYYSRGDLFNILYQSFILDKDRIFSKIVGKVYGLGEPTIVENLYTFALAMYERGDYNNSIDILKYILDSKGQTTIDIDESQKYRILRSLIYFLKASGTDELFNEYMNLFLKLPDSIKTELDIGVFSYAIIERVREGKVLAAKLILDVFDRKSSYFVNNYLFDYALILNLSMQIDLSLSRVQSAKISAKKILTLINLSNYNSDSKSILGKSGLETVVNQARNTLSEKSSEDKKTKSKSKNKKGY